MNRKHHIDIDFFIKSEKITKESAYILGLMWADGTIGSGNGNYQVSLTGVSDDFDQLIDVFNKTGNWGIYIRKAKGVRKQQTTYAVSYKKLYDALYKLDYKFKSTRSAIKILDLIPEELKCYWWLGFFDGDGCIYNNKNNQLFFTGSLDQDWSFFKSLPFDICWKHITKTTNNGNYSRMLIQNKDSIKIFCDYIYKTIETDKIGFFRKYEKYTCLKTPKQRKVVGLGGVYYNKKIKKWVARPTYNKIQYALGCFDSKDGAVKAVLNKRQEWDKEFIEKK